MRACWFSVEQPFYCVACGQLERLQLTNNLYYFDYPSLVVISICKCCELYSLLPFLVQFEAIEAVHFVAYLHSFRRTPVLAALSTVVPCTNLCEHVRLREVYGEPKSRLPRRACCLRARIN
jgi:hypothetical protein